MKRKIEYLIIGSGILGLSSAYYLAKNGFKCTVVDKKEFSSGASGVNLGQISLFDREPEIQLKLALDSLAEYRRLEKEWNKCFEYIENGGLYLIHNQGDLDEAKRLIELKKNTGLDNRLLSPIEAKSVEPYLNTEEIIGAVHCGREGQLNPHKVCCYFMDQAKALGVEFLENCEVTDFVVKNGIINDVIINNEPIEVGQVIMATGAWTRELALKLNLDYKIYYTRGTAMVSQPVPKVINGTIGPGIFTDNLYKKDSWTYLGMVQEKNGSIVIAQATSFVKDYDCSVDYQEITEIASLLKAHFPILRDLEIIRTWSGVTPHTKDGNPLFGVSGKVRNLFLTAGFKGAFTTAPCVGKCVAEYYLKRKTSIDLSSYSPKRFEI